MGTVLRGEKNGILVIKLSPFAGTKISPFTNSFFQIFLPKKIN
jgi:hypothetical protein